MRAFLWIVAVGLAVLPLLLWEVSREPASHGGVTQFVLMDGPVAASTDDVAAARSAGAGRGTSSGSVGESVMWTVAAGVLVLVAWGGVTVAERGLGKGTKAVAGQVVGRRRWLPAGWFAVTRAGRWSAAGVGKSGE